MKKYIILLIAALAVLFTSCSYIDKEVERITTVSVVNTSDYDVDIYFDNHYRGSVDACRNSTISIKGYYDRPIDVMFYLFYKGTRKKTSHITYTFHTDNQYKISISNSKTTITPY